MTPCFVIRIYEYIRIYTSQSSRKHERSIFDNLRLEHDWLINTGTYDFIVNRDIFAQTKVKRKFHFKYSMIGLIVVNMLWIEHLTIFSDDCE